MQKFTEKITFVKNGRGVWDLDPFKGCEDGIKNNPNGCYGLCYARNIAKFRGYDFGKTVYRHFEDEDQIKRIGKKLQQSSLIKGIQPPFVRLGVMCDPSFDWAHTIGIIGKLKKYLPNIVVITKHWKILDDSQLEKIGSFENMIFNTSISALDSEEQIEHRLSQYERLKSHCKSVLRVNTADFNDKRLKEAQNYLLYRKDVIDNILRIPKNHPLAISGIVNVEKLEFINGKVWASRFNKETYFGTCENCPDQCGIKKA